MAKRNSSKKPLFKRVEFYFILIYALLSIALLIQAFTVNVIPMKYSVILAVVLLLLFLGMYFLQMGKKVNKVNKGLGKVLIIVLSILLGIGNWYLFKTGSAFSRMTGDDTNTSVVSIVVLKKSAIKNIEDLKNKKLGKVSIGDSETLDKALADVKKDIGSDPLTVTYKDYKNYSNDLYDGKTDAIILNESSRGLVTETHKDFDNETRVIKQYTYKTKAKDISKSVDVTKDPFNVYITGIDTYGTLASVSRSDVNMIASVNPKTHQVLLISVPRDFYVPQTCQDNQLDKLTHTGIFGVDCTIKTSENFFKIDLNYYARVNFSSLVKIVDALGGISVDSPYAFTTRHGKYQIVKGLNEMDGEKALGFVRERYALADGDRERGRNQMRTLTAILKKAMSPAIITNYASIMDAVGGSLQTNMSTSEMTSLIKAQVNDMSGWDIKQISVSGQGKTAWTPANGFNAYVMVPNMDTVNSAIKLIEKIDQGESISEAEIKAHEALVSNAG